MGFSLSLYSAGGIDEKAKAQRDLHHGGAGCGEADAEKRHGKEPAHIPRDGKAHADGADDALRHDEGGVAAAVEIPHEAKEEGGEHAVDGVGLEIVGGGGDDVSVLGEDGGKEIAAETYTSAKSPPNWPTIIRSTALYIACRKRASSTGRQKRIKGA